MCSSRSNGIGCDIQFTGDLFDQNFLELLRNRDVINGKVGKAAALPKFSDTLTLSQSEGADYDQPLPLPHLKIFVITPLISLCTNMLHCALKKYLTKNDGMYEFEKSRHCIRYRVGLFVFFMFHFMFHPSLGQFPHFGSWLILNNFFRRSFQDIGIFLVVTEHCEQTSHDELENKIIINVFLCCISCYFFQENTKQKLSLI